MDIWKTLGIKQTTEINLIKQAYAEKLKEFHPEEYPEEFAELQKAYREAVAYARRHKNKASKSDELMGTIIGIDLENAKKHDMSDAVDEEDLSKPAGPDFDNILDKSVAKKREEAKASIPEILKQLETAYYKEDQFDPCFENREILKEPEFLHGLVDLIKRKKLTRKDKLDFVQNLIEPMLDDTELSDIYDDLFELQQAIKERQAQNLKEGGVIFWIFIGVVVTGIAAAIWFIVK